MNITRIIAELRDERDALDTAIVALEKIASRNPRRGRPPKWMSQARMALVTSGVVRRKPAASGTDASD